MLTFSALSLLTCGLVYIRPLLQKAQIALLLPFALTHGKGSITSVNNKALTLR